MGKIPKMMKGTKPTRSSRRNKWAKAPKTKVMKSAR